MFLNWKRVDLNWTLHAEHGEAGELELDDL